MTLQPILLFSLLITKSFLICNEETLVAACVVAFILVATPSVYQAVEGFLLEIANDTKAKNSELLIEEKSVNDIFFTYGQGSLEIASALDLTLESTNSFDKGSSDSSELSSWTSEQESKQEVKNLITSKDLKKNEVAQASRSSTARDVVSIVIL